MVLMLSLEPKFPIKYCIIFYFSLWLDELSFEGYDSSSLNILAFYFSEIISDGSFSKEDY
jgi:hypothetical protein